MLQIYTGNGKGKTTAALGLAVRAVGAGKKVAWIAFDKGGDAHYSERKIIAERFPEIDFYATGLDRIDPRTGRFRMGVTSQDIEEGERGLSILNQIFSQARHDLVILDEINCSAELGIVDEQIILDLLEQKPAEMELVLTGRNAPMSFMNLADLITEMQLHKHYFYQGVKARPGFDY